MPPCSSWDTGRVAPFLYVLLTDGISLVARFLYLYKCYLRTEYQKIQNWSNCIGKYDTRMQAHTQTNSNFINIDIEQMVPKLSFASL